MPYVNNEWVGPQPVTLETLNKKLDKLIASGAVVDQPQPPAESGRRAATVEDALLNAYLGLDADGYPHRWSGAHAGSTEDFAKHLVENNLQYPVIDFGPTQVGRPTYADWKDPLLALYLLSQSDGLKTPRELQLIGFYATQYDEKIKNNGWKTTTAAEWFAKIRSTNGQGGASGDRA